MSCRRTCRSGEWRAGRIWRRWVTHLSWITSRGQHLSVCGLPPCAVHRNHMTQPRTAGPISREQLSYWKCLLQINPRKTLLSLSRAPPERLSSFIRSLFFTTALHWKQRPFSDWFRKPVFGMTYYHTTISAVYTVHRVCILFVQKPRWQ